MVFACFVLLLSTFCKLIQACVGSITRESHSIIPFSERKLDKFFVFFAIFLEIFPKGMTRIRKLFMAAFFIIKGNWGRGNSRNPVVVTYK